MKVLKGTSAWIKGKLYKEGTSIPAQYEKEFEKFLVEKENPKTETTSKTKETSKTDTTSSSAVSAAKPKSRSSKKDS